MRSFHEEHGSDVRVRGGCARERLPLLWRSHVDRFVSGTGATGSFDTVILATGFESCISWLDPALLADVHMVGFDNGR